MSVKKQRKCSLCRLPGHTKRTCSDSSVGAQIKKTKPQVIVRVRQDAEQSPYVINLRDLSRSDVWDNVEVYQEISKQATKGREVVDFAAMVEVANHESVKDRYILSPQKFLVMPEEAMPSSKVVADKKIKKSDDPP